MSSVDAEVLAGPPSPGPTHAGDGTTDVTFTITKIYFGDTDRDGTPDRVNGWKAYGFDIDGKDSTAASTDLCIPNHNASPKNVYTDGPGGIDNSWGKLVLPIDLGIESDFPMKLNAALSTGKPRQLFTLEKLGAGTDYNPLPSEIFLTTNLATTPVYDGTDQFPIDPASLTDPTDVTTPRIVLPAAYVTGNTWVSTTTQGTLSFSVDSTGISAIALPGTVPLQAVRISMVLSPDHRSATHGTISGLLPLAAYVAAVRAYAGTFDTSLCSGPTTDSIVTQIEQAADIMQDGTQDPTKNCDGISIGLGFDAAIDEIGPIGPAVTPPTNPCGDAGP